VDEALSLMGRPARELAVSLERYPDLPHMPAELAYALALDRAEALDFEGARALFHDRFFPREEGGTNVRQVWVEVNIMQALADAAAGHCSAALPAADGLGAAVPGLPFTKDGLEPFVAAPRTQYLIGQVESRCGHAPQAAERWRRVGATKGMADLVWAWGAAKKLDGYDSAAWSKRLETALAQALARAESGPPYTAGALEAVLGKRADARSHFQQVLLLPDRRMSHHLSRMAMSGTGLPE
jgi:hypothetical protein